MQKISILTVFLVGFIILSCTRDVAPEITCEGVASWDENIQPIVETYCVYSGCHDGSPGVPGIYNNYASILPWLNDGSFDNRVVGTGDMPPNYATGPKEITPEDLDLLICWIEEEYPEN